jgi:hypothetical protein
MLIYKGFYDCRLNFRAGIKVTIYHISIVLSTEKIIFFKNFSH